MTRRIITIHDRYVANLTHMTVAEAEELVELALRGGQRATMVKVTNRAQRLLDQCHRVRSSGSWRSPNTVRLERIMREDMS